MIQNLGIEIRGLAITITFNVHVVIFIIETSKLSDPRSLGIFFRELHVVGSDVHKLFNYSITSTVS
jgi:hypothetical protein